MSVVNITLTPGTSFAWQNANLGGNPNRRATIFARFWANVHRPDAKACWIWQGYVGTHGYGVFGIGGPASGGQKRVRAHRFSWLASRGDIPAGVEVCHRCDVTRCVNPAHLFLGTHQSNHLDSVRKGRKHAWGLQKLNAAQVQQIRARLQAGERQRDIAAAFGVARTTVSGIARGASWGHLPSASEAQRQAS